MVFEELNSKTKIILFEEKKNEDPLKYDTYFGEREFTSNLFHEVNNSPHSGS